MATSLLDAILPPSVERIERILSACRTLHLAGGDFAEIGRFVATLATETAEFARWRRDQAISALFLDAVGSFAGRIKEVHDALSRYERAKWQRDRRSSVMPVEYEHQLALAACFEAMTADPKAASLSEKQVRRIVSNYCKQRGIDRHSLPVSMSIRSRHPAIIANSARMIGMQKPDDNREFIAALKDSDIGKKIRSEEAAATAKARRALINELAEIERLDAADFAHSEKEIAAAVKAAAIARADYEKRQNHAAALAAKRAGNAGSARSRREVIEAALRDSSAKSIIDAFIGEMRDDEDETRKKFVGGTHSERHPVTGKTTLHGYNNTASVQARICASRAAIAEAEALRLVADQSDVPLALEALRAALPQIEPPEYVK